MTDEELASAIFDSIYYSGHPSTVEFMRFTKEHIMKIDYWLDYLRREVKE